MTPLSSAIALALALTAVVPSAHAATPSLAAPAARPVRPADSLDDRLPEVPREFRGVWVASVGNIDWPSEPGLSTQQQQMELLAILDRAVALHLNAVILQVRPAADALYASPYEPWSEYLTGVMGQAPEPYYDPLAFAVAEAHRRGLELHAWFNPFRARYEGAKSPAAPNHVSRTHPELVKRYGGFLWMDPGEPAVREQARRVILDVVRRYDVDGVHIDDYFYPYREPARGGGYVPFPDDRSWARYQRSGGRLSRDDWRRSNVDGFVEELYTAVKAVKPWVKVGISPFGIWRPGHPASVRGLDAYTELFADSRKWIRNGWLDYLAPQLYWPTSAPQQGYATLLQWWLDQNTHGRHVWPGNFTSRVGDPRQPKWTPGELLAQVRLTRQSDGAGGNIHFSMSALLGDDNGLVQPLRRSAYAAPALVPASPWLERGDPPAAIVRVARTGRTAEGVSLELSSTQLPRVRTWIVRARYADGWSVRLVPGPQRSYFVAAGETGLPREIVVSAVDRVGVEGPTTVVRVETGTGE
ncbi:MAG TPA: family 10 glycosylhydrolase [Gemmatimonadaceae bacterium]|nr:family 10 glycosylhydrolase [Gemmatimonadaceae bacterium]